MAGIYIHIPFCKKACNYCDFHFSTSLKNKSSLVNALINEIKLRKNELKDEVIETIYFGGGTPSLLELDEITSLLESIKIDYLLSDNIELTIEVNPDDISEEKLISWKSLGVNRLSVGVQSFFDRDLKLMNRAHNSRQSEESIKLVAKYFDNFTIDLIYGIPEMNSQEWISNLEKAIAFGVPHISCYALTVEPKTALEKQIASGKISPVNDDVYLEHFNIMTSFLKSNGFIHYEFSNFSKEGYYSKNNSAYWKGEKYLGIGPSAHSFNGINRSWNISNNNIYIKKIANNILPSEAENLSLKDRYNEYVMTGLRTIWGISLNEIESQFGLEIKNYFLDTIVNLNLREKLNFEEDRITILSEYKFLTDGIASDLFKI